MVLRPPLGKNEQLRKSDKQPLTSILAQERVFYFANLDAAEKFKQTLEAYLNIRNVQMVKIIGDFDSAQEKV